MSKYRPLSNMPLSTLCRICPFLDQGRMTSGAKGIAISSPIPKLHSSLNKHQLFESLIAANSTVMYITCASIERVIIDDSIDGILFHNAKWERSLEFPDDSLDTEKWEEDLLFLESLQPSEKEGRIQI